MKRTFFLAFLALMCVSMSTPAQAQTQSHVQQKDTSWFAYDDAMTAGELSGTGGDMGGCHVDQPACTHSCTHVGPGINGCGGQNPCSHIKLDTTRREGQNIVRRTYYSGADFGDPINGYCCASSTSSCEHVSSVYCPVTP